MRTPRLYRCTALAVLAATAVMGACDDSTRSLTPAERADVIRTVVELGTTNSNRILRAGHTVRVSALVTDEFNQALPGVPLVWTTLGGGSVASDSGFTGGNGTLGGIWTAGTKAGLQTVVATVDGGTGIASGSDLFVYADTVVGSLKLSTRVDSVTSGEVLLVRVVSAADRYGNPYSLSGTQPDSPPPIEFASLNPNVVALVATTGSNAVAKGLLPGIARVVARSDGKADTVTVFVLPPPVVTPH